LAEAPLSDTAWTEQEAFFWNEQALKKLDFVKDQTLPKSHPPFATTTDIASILPHITNHPPLGKGAFESVALAPPKSAKVDHRRVQLVEIHRLHS
jgi:hypothetical protein